MSHATFAAPEILLQRALWTYHLLHPADVSLQLAAHLRHHYSRTHPRHHLMQQMRNQTRNLKSLLSYLATHQIVLGDDFELVYLSCTIEMRILYGPYASIYQQSVLIVNDSAFIDACVAPNASTFQNNCDDICTC